MMPGFFDDPDLTYRMSMLPLGTYSDPNGGPDHLGFAVPGMLAEPINALYRLAQNSVDENGNIAIPNPENPQNREDVLTGILSMYGGNALNPARALEGAAIRDAAPVAESPVRSSRVYHGSYHDDPFHLETSNHNAIFTAQDPEFSAGFGNRIFPLDLQPGNYFDFRNPEHIEAVLATRPWDRPDATPQYLQAKEDFLRNGAWQQIESGPVRKWIDDNGFDGFWLAHTYKPGAENDSIALRVPGKLKSATTGETLFSDTGRPSLLGSAVADDNIPPEARNYLLTY